MSTIYNNFAASKMSNNPKFEVVVTFKDFLGKTHNIVCRNRRKLAEANEMELNSAGFGSVANFLIK